MKRRESTSLRTVGFILTALVLAFVIIGLFYTPYDPNAMNGLKKNLPPSFLHPFGTDNFGRDLLSRVMDGSSTTFLIAICTVFIGSTIGILLGAVTGYMGGILDQILMRINDIIASFPSILLALILVSVIGPGKYNIFIALSIVFIPSFARITRSEFVVQKEMDYVKNARIMGAGHVRIMFVHIFPNTLSMLWPAIMIGFNNAILAEAGMSYLGLGVQPPDASLGRMLAESQTYLLSAPWYAISTGLFIIMTVLGFSLLVKEQ